MARFNPEKFFWPLLLLALLPWFIIQSQYSMNANIVWLTHGVTRLLDGGTMSGNIYDPNPPLSLLFYIPPVLVAKYSFITLPDALTLYTTLLLALSVWAVHSILGAWHFLSRNDVRIITATYLIAATVVSVFDYGERDHVLLFGLFPFVLAQISLTYRLPLPKKLSWPVFIAGAVLILLKPHHGLLPTLLLVHRMIVQKRLFSIVRDRDFLCLAAATLSYIAIIFLFFRDYTTVIFPDVLTLYMSAGTKPVILRSLLFVFLIFTTTMLTLSFELPQQKRNLLLGLLFFALISIVPFLVQMKGYHYHRITALVFFSCGTLFLPYLLLSKYITEGKALLVTTILGLSVAHSLYPLNPAYPTHEEYKDYELSRLIKDCGEDCSFFMFNESMAIYHVTAFSLGKEHASRFPSYWFLPYLIRQQYLHRKGEEAEIGKERLQQYIDKYTGMVAEDFSSYQPDLVFLAELTADVADGTMPFDFIDFFSAGAAFRKEWEEHYTKTGTIDINRRIYFPNTILDEDHIITYDIYRRK